MKTATRSSLNGAILWACRGCGVFHVRDGKITFQRGDRDRLSFLRTHGLPVS
jgi:hypothetical protein